MNPSDIPVTANPPIRILVIGASGGTGAQIVRQASTRGCDLTVLARTPAKLPRDASIATIVQGDVLDARAVRAAIHPGIDAILCALGSPSSEPTTVFSSGVTNILSAMREASVKRFIGISASAMHVDRYDSILTRVAKPILQRVFRHSYRDMGVMESILKASDADWTIVVPPRLTDGPRTTNYRRALDHNVPGGFSLSRADLADCMLSAITDEAAFRRLLFAAL